MRQSLERLTPYVINRNANIQAMAQRLGNINLPLRYYPDTVDAANEMVMGLVMRGGLPQQERMVKDKLKSLDHATLYSYQAARIRKVGPPGSLMEGESQLVRALINPDKTKMDYDDKILSVRFDYGFAPGDVFAWDRTNSYWLIRLQDLNELAYFRGEIRRCDYEIHWLDDEGNEKSTYAAIRGPVETKINYIQKHGISVDEPNHSLHIYMPRNPDTMKQFRRYSKFYLSDADSPDDKICWRVEAFDGISTKGILEVTAVEYYANETEDDIEKGLVGTKVTKLVEPETDFNIDIVGDTFIKPKKEYTYYAETTQAGKWSIVGPQVPVVLKPFTTERGIAGVILKWNTSYSGSFTLEYGNENGHYKNFTKQIVVESLF